MSGSKLTVIKRDGRKVKFNRNSVVNALSEAFISVFPEVDEEELLERVNKVTRKVVSEIKKVNVTEISVEDIQNIVEKQLMLAKEVEVSKSYILYRSKRTDMRDANTEIMLKYKEIAYKEAEEVDSKRENANVDGNTAMGSMLQYGSTGSRIFALKNMIKEAHSKAHNKGLIHIHDLDFLPMGTTTCTQIDIVKLFEDGFSTGHGHLREPQDVHSYAALAAIAIQSNQNDQHGGQSIPNFDYGIAIGVRKTFIRAYKENLVKFLAMEFEDADINEIEKLVNSCVGQYTKNGGSGFPQMNKQLFNEYKNLETPLLATKLSQTFKELVSVEPLAIAEDAQEFAYKFAKKETKKKTHQAMEGFIHNLNTMHSRAGAQVPFSSINFGTDTSDEGRLVIEQILLATEEGLGNGETAIFPISIFKVKEGINFNPEDISYDLFKLAIRVSAKRLFPNFCFIDAPFNLQYYKQGRPETEIATMGCRTRVFGSVHEETDGIIYGRGNNSFTTLNLPRLAIKRGIALGERTEADMEGFYADLKSVMALCVEQIYDRYKIQCAKKVKNFPFLMGQGNWQFSDKLGWNDTLEEILKHGSLSIGFIGLAETLIALTGEHHGESEKAQQLGLEIIGFMRKYLDEVAQQYKLNFTLLATPAEGLSGRFVRMDKKLFGALKGVTDKDYYTNSFHVPVYHVISALNKIKLEAPYHALCNAGHITYVELDGDVTKNLEAFEMIIRAMKEYGIGYGSVNHPIDRDPVCGFNGIINDTCPCCGRKEKHSEVVRLKRKKL